jgi:hypothetical protein
MQDAIASISQKYGFSTDGSAYERSRRAAASEERKKLSGKTECRPLWRINWRRRGGA